MKKDYRLKSSFDSIADTVRSAYNTINSGFSAKKQSLSRAVRKAGFYTLIATQIVPFAYAGDRSHRDHMREQTYTNDGTGHTPTRHEGAETPHKDTHLENRTNNTDGYEAEYKEERDDWLPIVLIATGGILYLIFHDDHGTPTKKVRIGEYDPGKPPIPETTPMKYRTIPLVKPGSPGVPRIPLPQKYRQIPAQKPTGPQWRKPCQ